MKNLFRSIISLLCLASIMLAATSVFAAPVRLNQVIQVVNAKPGKANSGNFSQLRLVDDLVIKTDDDDDDTVTATPVQDDDRVIITKTMEIVEDDVCLCEQPPKGGGKFPYWALGFAAVPLLFLIPGRDRTKTPTPTIPTTETPTPTPTTPTPTPTTPTPTPKTPTPTPPEPVPEPMTLLLFGTGLAGIGVAARKKFGKKEK
jgi:cell division protein FtsN